MRKVLKISMAIAALVCVLTALTACADIFGNPNSNKPENEGYKRIVYAENVDISSMRQSIVEITGNIGCVTSDEAAIDGEIVFGDTSREITAKAKAALADEISESDEFDCGYIIYAEGNNLAIYWQLDDMKDLVFDYFKTECINTDRLELDEGVVHVELYTKSFFEIEGKWLAIEKKFGKQVESAMRALYNFYEGDKIVDWLANLYDPKVGGFYYSRSARDYGDFLPDLESTQQTFGILINLGAISNRNAVIPNEIRGKIINFAREMQSPVDGYFYHPQWAQDKELLATDRYGRDQDNAEAIIERFTYDEDGDGIDEKQYPKYCSVTGMKCKKHAEEGHCSFPVAASSYAKRVGADSALSVSLTSSVSSAVSMVQNSYVKATASTHPDYSSAAAFKAWLEEYNATIKENSGGAHNLAAMTDEIIHNGYEDILLDHLDAKQAELFEEQSDNFEKPTGTWQRPINYRNVWGTYKYMSIYNTVGRPLNLEYVPYMVDTCLAVIMLPAADGGYAYNDIMNQWSALTSIITNVNRYYGSEEAGEIYKKIQANPVELIQNSLEKLRPFKREDGSFSVQVSGMTPTTIYGVPIAMGVVEGSVNSTHITLNMYSNICTAMGCPKVPLCTAEDGERFAQIISNAEPIDKIELEVETYDFEDLDIPDTVKLNKVNTDSYIEIVEDPTGESNALHFYSPTSTSSGDILTVTASGAGGNCYVLDMDMYIDSGSAKSGTLSQLSLGKTAYMLAFDRSGDNIKVNELTSIYGDGKKLLKTVPIDEWFNVRIEYYVNDEETNSLDVPMIKVWIGEEHVITSNSFYGSHVAGAAPNNTVNYIEILSLRSPETHMYFDNILLMKDNRVFDAYDNEITD